MFQSYPRRFNYIRDGDLNTIRLLLPLMLPRSLPNCTRSAPCLEPRMLPRAKAPSAPRLAANVRARPLAQISRCAPRRPFPTAQKSNLCDVNGDRCAQLEERDEMERELEMLKKQIESSLPPSPARKG